LQPSDSYPSAPLNSKRLEKPHTIASQRPILWRDLHTGFVALGVLVDNAGVMLLAGFSSEQRDEHRRMVETNRR
jgi:short-subunit dehydrogenase